MVTPCSKANLNHFEMQSRKLIPGGSGNQHMSSNTSNPRPFNPSSGNLRPPMMTRPTRPNGPLLGQAPRMSLSNQGNGGPFQGQSSWHGLGGSTRGQAPLHSGSTRPGLPLMRLPSNQRGAPSQPLLRGPGLSDLRSNHPSSLPDWGDHSSHSGLSSGQQNSMGLSQGHVQSNSSLSSRPPGIYKFLFSCKLHIPLHSDH